MSTDAPSVLAQVGTPTGCTLWRVWQPITHLQRGGYPAEWVYREDPRVMAVAPVFDAYLLPRVFWPLAQRGAMQRWFAAARRAGKTTIYELDDDLLSPWIIDFQKAGGVQRDRPVEAIEHDRQAVIAALRLCDGVTVTTPRLATVVAQYTDAPVVVVPNAIDLRWFRAVQKHAKRLVRGLTIGWAGGTRPDRDTEAMARAWGQVCQRYPHVTFVVQGYQPAVIREHVPAHRLFTLPFMPLEEYPLGLTNIDIGCAPLTDRAFNRCKTPIKVWEYAASGAAAVASPTVYRHTITHGEDGLLCETAEEWEDALALLIEDEQRRKKLARRQLRRVERDHSLETQAWRWPAAWAQLAEAARRPRLELVTA